jgi:hypothetical protein
MQRRNYAVGAQRPAKLIVTGIEGRHGNPLGAGKTPDQPIVHLTRKTVKSTSACCPGKQHVATWNECEKMHFNVLSCE